MFQIIHEYMFPESKMESYEPSESTKFYYFALKRAEEKSGKRKEEKTEDQAARTHKQRQEQTANPPTNSARLQHVRPHCSGAHSPSPG